MYYTIMLTNQHISKLIPMIPDLQSCYFVLRHCHFLVVVTLIVSTHKELYYEYLLPDNHPLSTSHEHYKTHHVLLPPITAPCSIPLGLCHGMSNGYIDVCKWWHLPDSGWILSLSRSLYKQLYMAIINCCMPQSGLWTTKCINTVNIDCSTGDTIAINLVELIYLASKLKPDEVLRLNLKNWG